VSGELGLGRPGLDRVRRHTGEAGLDDYA
jgi:hypothetical protein